MTTFKDLIKATREEKPITLRHERWLEQNSTAYSELALALAQDVLSGLKGGGRDRSIVFRGSGTGMCQRKRLFEARGVEKIETLDGITANIFNTGHFLHLKWQMAGLTEGWLKDAEVPVQNEELNIAGTMDGIVYDDSIFEFKSINARGFAQLATYGPKAIHRHQIHAYMLMSGMDRASIVYENKDTQDWREFVIHRDEALTTIIKDELIALNRHLENGTIPRMLSDCTTKTGYIYRGCAFRDICPTMGNT